MDRAILLVAAAVWLTAAAAGLALAAAGMDVIRSVLPPLAIGEGALRRTVATLAAGALLIGLAHVVVTVGVARGHVWAASAGLLLAGICVAGFTALGAAAWTAGASGSMLPAVAFGSATGALLVAAAYAVAGVALGRRLGTGSAR
ncbi:MAG: hypothetical protein KY392_04405 [Chloroflexi bacterium]|nr:hypothetical protein [Chloroflexota bacterium]